MATTDTTQAADGYVDLYLLPVPAAKMDAYREHATVFGIAVKDHGGLAYREFRADDVGEGFSAPEGTVLTAAVAEFATRKHRDEVMAKVLADPRVVALEGETLADMSLMRYGGFRTFVDP